MLKIGNRTIIDIMRDKYQLYLQTSNGAYKQEIRGLYNEYKKHGGKRELKEILKTSINFED